MLQRYQSLQNLKPTEVLTTSVKKYIMKRKKQKSHQPKSHIYSLNIHYPSIQDQTFYLERLIFRA